MTHKEWADNTVNSFNKVRAAMQNLSSSSAPKKEVPLVAGKNTGENIAVTLMAFLKNNDATAQALAAEIAEKVMPKIIYTIRGRGQIDFTRR